MYLKLPLQNFLFQPRSGVMHAPGSFGSGLVLFVTLSSETIGERLLHARHNADMQERQTAAQLLNTFSFKQIITL